MNTEIYNDIIELVNKKEWSVSIYTKHGNLFSIVKYDDILYYYDEDVVIDAENMTFDLLHLFEEKSFNQSDIACIDGSKHSGEMINKFIGKKFVVNVDQIHIIFGKVDDIPSVDN